MSQFSYSFCVSLFHSLWQSALLLVLYSAMQQVIKKPLPFIKRNILFGLLITQVVISVITFFLYYNRDGEIFGSNIEAGLSNIFFHQTLIEKYAPWLTGLYTLVIIFKLCQLLYSWFRFKYLCNSTLIKPSIDLKLFMLRRANEFGIRRKVTIWLSNAVSTPLTFGFLKPVILMPVALLNHLSVEDTESLIIHELTHIKNNDYFLNWLLIIVETFYFFNPFISILSSKIKLEREKNCDVQVLQFKYPAINYAETLLKAASFKSNINCFPIAAVFKNKQLLKRILFFTTDQNLEFSKTRHRSIAAPVIILAMLINLFILSQVKNPTASVKNMEQVVLFNPTPGNADGSTAAMLSPLSDELTQDANPVASDMVNEETAVGDQQLKERAEAADASEKIAQEIEDAEMEANFAIRAAALETAQKEIIVKEEVSGSGEAVTKAYTLRVKNGEWKDELLYIVREGKLLKDSTICYLKDSVTRYVPAMQ